jgi:uncharacterized glyoxalase superfamily protein PhnB
MGASQTAQEIRGGVAPYLTVDGASRAPEFYQRAFGAEEVYRHPVDEKGRTMHIHLFVNGGSLRCGARSPGRRCSAPSVWLNDTAKCDLLETRRFPSGNPLRRHARRG